ncbi:MAG: hypothetical protein Q9181_000927 [Wetmoreana brouardii]
MSILLLLLYLFAHALALPPISHLTPGGLDISQQNAKRAPPRSASLPVSRFPNTPFWTSVLSVNGRKVKVMIDTGSADFWLHGPNAPSSKGTPGAKVVPDETFEIGYGGNDGVQRGVGVSTTVQIGDLRLTDYTVGVTTHDDYKSSLDGIMGLGFQGSNSFRPTQQPTVMEAAQKLLQQPVFTLNLKPDSGGTLDFGIVDHSKHKGSLVEAKANIGIASWTVDAVTLSAGKAKVTQKMLFDTGGGDTMLADGKFVTDYWKQVSGNKYIDGAWIFPCNNKPPDIKIGIGRDGSATIPGQRLKGKPVGSGERS